MTTFQGTSTGYIPAAAGRNPPSKTTPPPNVPQDRLGNPGYNHHLRRTQIPHTTNSQAASQTPPILRLKKLLFSMGNDELRRCGKRPWREQTFRGQSSRSARSKGAPHRREKRRKSCFRRNSSHNILRTCALWSTNRRQKNFGIP